MSKSKSNKKGKKAKKSKTETVSRGPTAFLLSRFERGPLIVAFSLRCQTPFRILDLPTELIEDICMILVEQNRKKSLATLNVANKFLRDVTTPYLWETVRWTKATWNPLVYMAKGGPEMLALFAHIK
jgi:hypothetical protein